MLKMRWRKFFFFTDTATTEIYTLSLHDALPISAGFGEGVIRAGCSPELDETRALAGDTRTWIANLERAERERTGVRGLRVRSEEHTSELQSRQYLVCSLLLEKKISTIIHLILTI